MKKFLVYGFLFLVLCWSNCAYSFDKEKVQLLSEIGVLSNSQKYDEALSKCNYALGKYPDDAEFYYWSGVIKANTGDNTGALADYDKAVKFNPDDSNVYVMRGITKSDVGDEKGALADFDHALKLNPKNGSAYSMRACLKINSGDLKGANEDLDAANKLFDAENKSEHK